jgi:hypothetical protein
MKAIILASGATVVSFIVAVIIFQAARIERRARALLLIYLVVLCGLAAVSLATSQSLWLLPQFLIAEPPWLDVIATLFFYSAAFFGGLLQLYNLADRGLSLRILIDVLERGPHGASLIELFEGYSAGRGLIWMYDKRLHGMVDSRLACVDGEMLVLTDRGRVLADIYSWLRRLLRTGKA